MFRNQHRIFYTVKWKTLGNASLSHKHTAGIVFENRNSIPVTSMTSRIYAISHINTCAAVSLPLIRMRIGNDDAWTTEMNEKCMLTYKRMNVFLPAFRAMMFKIKGGISIRGSFSQAIQYVFMSILHLLVDSVCRSFTFEVFIIKPHHTTPHQNTTQHTTPRHTPHYLTL